MYIINDVIDWVLRKWIDYTNRINEYIKDM